MGKKDEYRFNLRFDETDEMHRLVVKYLNSCGHNKAKYIVRAFLAYWKMSGKSLLSYVFPEIDAEQLLPEAKQENDKKAAVVAKDKEAAVAALANAISTIDKAATKGVYHKNNAARKVSRLSKAVNTLN